MKVLITGINGMLGKDIGLYLGFNKENDIYGIGRAKICYVPNVLYERLDLQQSDAVKAYIDKIRPDAIIHCAAMSKIDQCEDDKEGARKINVEATRILAEYGSRFIYFSTDAVFDGLNSHYSEKDVPSPVNFYGESKLLGEEATLQSNKKSLVIRTAMYGYNINGNVSLSERAAQTIVEHLPMKAFRDSITNPLYTKQIAYVIKRLLKEDVFGILHLGSDISVSKYEFFCMLAKSMKCSSKNIELSSLEDANFRVRRTMNTSLSVNRFNQVLNENLSLQTGIKAFYQDYLKWLC